MKFTRSRIILCLLVFVVVVLLKLTCYTKVYADEQMAFDPKTRLLFNAICHDDTINFTNGVGRKKTFVVTSLDSLLINEKGWLINQAPYNQIVIKLREIGIDTVSLIRENEFFISKDPFVGKTSLGIYFVNQLYRTDSIQGALATKEYQLASNPVRNYYLFDSLSSDLNRGKFAFLMLTEQFGITAFRRDTNELWVNNKVQ